jgi:hypothetical protein
VKFKPVQIEIANVRGQTTGSDGLPAPEPSHIHIPRPSRVRLELAPPVADEAQAA